ncbi:endolytic transglycosylase MltG [Aurantiacibacter gangjinensis]|uniref:Endolytic murein transglycosylase n=1 Tax=Aurantiacibacter gangjinensis TaxID=502682 RepID=A0A0G9MR61_9SPHN|nr:endolytic transglycosylase MltG [Aurantiacibacter gangjinensis]APE28974.1 protein YceG like [Aurantiacibacter gangjinensis]KLE33089.1 aminodeoxychorismate lyase [Aurantiacibacter gangjinensis]
MKKAIAALAVLGLLVVVAVGGWLAMPWYSSAQVDEETAFIVPSGASLTSVAGLLEEEGHIASADSFLLRAKVLGGKAPIKAGEFLLPAGASQADILDTFQNGDVIRRFVTIPEGTPSVIVHDILMAEELLVGDIPVPEEGSVLPESYDFERGEERIAVLARMQRAMDETIAELWPQRGPNTVVTSPEEAVTLASIVEKETGVPEERRMVAGLYSNRLRQGIWLQADPTIIYPITRGRPLGRRIRQSEIQAINDYNTYSMEGLPAGPITNPGRASIEAVLNPEDTDAVFMVADGTGGHEFNATLEGHNAAVERWFALRRERGEM